MKLTSKVATVTLVVAVFAFLAGSNGPLGGFWAPHPTVPQPVGAQLPRFMLLSAVEALALGLAVAFLVFGYGALEAGTAAPVPMTRAAHLSIVWLLGNWWAHDSFHIHNGLDLSGLLAIEYSFHLTLIISGLILARFFLATVGARA